MDNPDLLLLARAQFGLNIGFHILFPSLTIALAWFLVYFRIRYAKTEGGITATISQLDGSRSQAFVFQKK